MSILIECVCGARYEVEASRAGGSVDCSRCDRELAVPSQEWSDGYRALLGKIESGNEEQRIAAYREVARLGTPACLPVFCRGVYDPSRGVVNVVLGSLLTIGEFGREQVLHYIGEGSLKAARLVAMARETSRADLADVFCEMIDAGRFNESQTAEIIPFLGDSGRPRCVATLKALRSVYPNLGALLDNALSRFKNVQQDATEIPFDARAVSDGRLEAVQEMAASQRTAAKKGCFVSLLLFMLPAAGGALWWMMG